MKSIKNVRLPAYDYSSIGYYFVTICADQRHPILPALTSTIENAICTIKDDGASVDFHVIMPDHIHLIVVLDDIGVTLGEIVRRFKARSSREAGRRLWQPNYYEHVIRTEKALEKIREYIQNNPQALEIELEEFYR
ncbi:MAG: transposase [Nitrospirae bacterium]|nr:transposase [Nitrospirota bacterium]